MHATASTTMSATNANPAINPAIIPLAVLCGILVVGGVAAVFITRRIARVRLLLELRWAAEAKAADERLGDKPVLADVYVGSSPDLSSIEGEGKLPWTVVQVSYLLTAHATHSHQGCDISVAHISCSPPRSVVTAPASYNREPPRLCAFAAHRWQRPPSLGRNRHAQRILSRRRRRSSAAYSRLLHRHLGRGRMHLAERETAAYRNQLME